MWTEPVSFTVGFGVVDFGGAGDVVGGVVVPPPLSPPPVAPPPVEPVGVSVSCPVGVSNCLATAAATFGRGRHRHPTFPVRPSSRWRSSVLRSRLRPGCSRRACRRRCLRRSGTCSGWSRSAPRRRTGWLPHDPSGTQLPCFQALFEREGIGEQRRLAFFGADQVDRDRVTAGRAVPQAEPGREGDHRIACAIGDAHQRAALRHHDRRVGTGAEHRVDHRSVFGPAFGEFRFVGGFWLPSG